MMPNNVAREKLLNAILFFTKRVKYPVDVKIFKLLFLLDFMHFKQTGESVTNLDYHAWKTGPVPNDLWEEIKTGIVPGDFQQDLSIVPFQAVLDREGFEFNAKRNANLAIFSRREKKILDELAVTFEDASPHVMPEASHLRNKPWKKTYEEKGELALIDYLLAIDNEALIPREHAIAALQQRAQALLEAPAKPVIKGSHNFS